MPEPVLFARCTRSLGAVDHAETEPTSTSAATEATVAVTPVPNVTMTDDALGTLHGSGDQQDAYVLKLAARVLFVGC